MSNKKLLSLTVAVIVITLVFLITITLLRGTSLKNIMIGISLSTIYILLIISYLSRIALIFFGVFAVYKMLRERAN